MMFVRRSSKSLYFFCWRGGGWQRVCWFIFQSVSPCSFFRTVGNLISRFWVDLYTIRFSQFTHLTTPVDFCSICRISAASLSWYWATLYTPSIEKIQYTVTILGICRSEGSSSISWCGQWWREEGEGVTVVVLQSDLCRVRLLGVQ